MIFEETGECRIPKKGEWYFLDDGGILARAEHDFSGVSARAIYTMRSEEIFPIWTEEIPF